MVQNIYMYICTYICTYILTPKFYAIRSNVRHVYNYWCITTSRYHSCFCAVPSSRADREKSLLQGKLRSAQKAAIDPALGQTRHCQQPAWPSPPSEASRLLGAEQECTLKSRVFELENQVIIFLCECEAVLQAAVTLTARWCLQIYTCRYTLNTWLISLTEKQLIMIID